MHAVERFGLAPSQIGLRYDTGRVITSAASAPPLPHLYTTLPLCCCMLDAYHVVSTMDAANDEGHTGSGSLITWLHVATCPHRLRFLIFWYFVEINNFV
jgi:hypothetical protein